MTLRACQACGDEPARWLVKTLPWMFLPKDKTKATYRDSGEWRVGDECHRAIKNRNIPALRARMAKMMVESPNYEEYRESHRGATATVSQGFAESIIKYQVSIEELDDSDDSLALEVIDVELIDVETVSMKYEPERNIPPCLGCGEAGMLRMAHVEQIDDDLRNGNLPEGTPIEGVCITCMVRVGTHCMEHAKRGCPACHERARDWYILIATTMRMVNEADEMAETRALPFPILAPTLEPHVDGCPLAHDPLGK